MLRVMDKNDAVLARVSTQADNNNSWKWTELTTKISDLPPSAVRILVMLLGDDFSITGMKLTLERD